MPRTTERIAFTRDREEVAAIVSAILTEKGYKPVTYNGEECFKYGIGVMTAMKYIKTEFSENELVLTGWVCSGLGGATFDEMPLTGFVGMIPKKSVLKVFKAIKEAIQ